eukprot:scaffold83676_cov15-Tisochrysis_lutea.AAC.2
MVGVVSCGYQMERNISRNNCQVPPFGTKDSYPLRTPGHVPGACPLIPPATNGARFLPLGQSIQPPCMHEKNDDQTKR